MSIGALLMGLLIAFCFTSWPIVVKFSRVGGAWGGTIVFVATCLSVALFSGKQLLGSSLPNLKALMILLVAGTINGFGCYLYSLKSSDQNIAIGVFIPTIAVMGIMLAPILAFIFDRGTVITVRQVVGMLIAGVAIYLITSK